MSTDHTRICEVTIPQLHYENLTAVHGEHLKLRAGLRGLIESVRGDVRNADLVNRLHELLEGQGV